MQTYLKVAASLAFLTGIVHSALGEILIFRHLRQGTVVPGQDAPPLCSRHVRILWATWHLASVFGCALAVVMLQITISPQADPVSLLLSATAAAYAGAAVLVLAGTRGRHPGWIALGAVALLAWAAGGSA